MKTIALRNIAGTIDADIMVDIFAKNSELLEAGYDTRFTHMEIGPGYKDNDNAIATIGQLQEVGSSWQAIIARATSVGLGLYLSDMNDTAQSATAQVVSVALSGEAGEAVITVDGATYTVEAAASLTATGENFLSAHAASLELAGIIVTHPMEDGVLVFTAANEGVPFGINITNTSGDLTGEVTTITENVTEGGEVQVIMPTI